MGAKELCLRIMYLVHFAWAAFILGNLPAYLQVGAHPLCAFTCCSASDYMFPLHLYNLFSSSAFSSCQAFGDNQAFIKEVETNQTVKALVSCVGLMNLLAGCLYAGAVQGDDKGKKKALQYVAVTPSHTHTHTLSLSRALFFVFTSLFSARYGVMIDCALVIYLTNYTFKFFYQQDEQACGNLLPLCESALLLTLLFFVFVLGVSSILFPLFWLPLFLSFFSFSCRNKQSKRYAMTGVFAAIFVLATYAAYCPVAKPTGAATPKKKAT